MRGKGALTRQATPPDKLCATCNKPFSWRKKWERSWEQVKYCSGRCQRNKPTAPSE